MPFSEELSRLLQVRGSKTRLARALGTTEATVSRWCSGGAQPDLETVEQIAAALGVRPAELLGPQAEIESPPGWARIEVLPCFHGKEDERRRFIMLPLHLVAGLAALAIRAHGDCMAPDIVEGDVVLVDTKTPPKQGDRVAVVHSDADSCCLRRWHQSGDDVILTADNPRHAPVRLPLRKAMEAVRGVVIALCYRALRGGGSRES
jgi:phage repressor protein C with HTH and peptisase S24 domain